MMMTKTREEMEAVARTLTDEKLVSQLSMFAVWLGGDDKELRHSTNDALEVTKDEILRRLKNRL